MGTTSMTGTLTTVTGTSTLTTTSVTTTSITTTAIPGTCSVPVLGPTFDTSDCSDIFPPGACEVRCATGFVGTASSFACTSSDDGFVGVSPVCTSTTTTTSLTATTTTTTTITTTTTTTTA